MSGTQTGFAARFGTVGWLLGALVFRTAEFWKIVIRNRELIRELVRRDLKGGHAGHGLGSAWVYLQPLFVVATFMVIFGVVLGSRLGVPSALPGDYTGYILAGLVPWLMTANALSRAPTVFTANSNLVKQVIFPIETLPASSAIACVLSFAPSYIVLLCYLVLTGTVSLLWLLLPAVIALHVLLIVGLMLTLSVVTPFLRDIRELVTVYTAISLYVTPAIYLPEWVPNALKPVLYANPFSYVVWVYQDLLIFGAIVHPWAWVVFAGLAAVSFVVGLFVFRQAKRYLGNVL